MSEIGSILPESAEPIVDRKLFAMELQKYYDGHDENSKKLEWTSERIKSVIKLLDGYNLAKSQGKRATNTQYHHAHKYDVMDIGNKKVFIMKRKVISEPVVQIISTDEYYQTILDAHIVTGHRRRDKIIHTLRDKYVVPIFAINIFLNLCITCQAKKSTPTRKIVEKPLISDNCNKIGQLDLIDFQESPDGEYKWLLHYQDHLTKFSFLQPLKTDQTKEVTMEILKIFLEVGFPNVVIQSNHGYELMVSILNEILVLWPACKIINGSTSYPQIIENSSRDIKQLVCTWMADNKSTNWSLGCHFVQFQKNSSFDTSIARTPYKALFGKDPKLGITFTHIP